MGLLSAKCDRCGSTEHATKDCPHGVFSSRCDRCGSIDHSTKDCPHGVFSSKCDMCGSTEHSTEDCPHGVFSSKCDRCGSTEHATKDCPHGVFTSKCDRCGSTEHTIKDCPQGIFESNTKSNHETQTNSSSSGNSGCILGIVVIIGAILLVVAAFWLAVNIVLPISLLNSALVLTILALCFKKYKTLFATFALVGGCYMLLDITNGWFSTIFVNNVVKDPNWISGFVYLNSIAIGFSTWLLVQPLWQKAKLIGTSNRRNGIILKVISIFLVVIALATAPIVYYFVPNQFVQQAYSKSDISSRIENSAPISTPQNIEDNRTLPKDTPKNQEPPENSIPINTPKIQYGSLTDIDGNEYKTLTIGTQVWMEENLKTTKYNDGTAIPNVTNNTAWEALSTGAYCWYDNNANTYKATYGTLYNWYAVNTGNLCPKGWNVPSDEEWTILTSNLGGESVAGGKLKEIGTTHWQAPNTGATNYSGFTALSGGCRSYDGSFLGIGNTGTWWSSTEVSTSRAWSRSMPYSNGTAASYNVNKTYGFSVRCVKG